MGREVKTGIVVEGEDRGGTKVMKNVSKEAGKMEARLDGVKKGVVALPGQFGQAAAAMMLMQGATSQMGGKVADATNKVAALGALVAVGGPVGIGIAALSAAVMIGTAIWGSHTEETRKAAEKQKDLIAKMDESLKAIRAQNQALKDTTDTLGRWGETMSQVVIRNLREEITATENLALARGREMARRGRELVLVERSIAAVGVYKEKQVSAAYQQKITAEGLEREATALRDKITADEKAIMIADEALKGLYVKEATETEANRRREETIAIEKRITSVAKEREELERARADRIREEGELVIAALEREEAAEADALAARLAAIDRFTQARDRLRQQDLAREEQAARTRVALDEQLAAQKLASAQAAAAAIAAQTTAVLTNAKMAADAEEDTAKKSEAFARAAAKQVIQILAVKGAAAAFEKAVEQFGMPYGAIIGAVVSAAAFALVNAFAEKLALGGFVRGGIPGRDSVLASLTPGEYVASTSEVAGFRKFATRLLGEKEGRQLATTAGMERVAAVEPMRSGRGGTTIINQMWQPENVAMMRLTRRQSRTVRKLRARGMY